MTNERVILVHGTGATAPSAQGNAWWQTGGTLWSWAERSGYEVEAFIWSGANDEAARRLAGQGLAARVLKLDREGERVHLVGHSHGGSVLWHALLQLVVVNRETASRALLSWTSVGTPFLHYGLRRPALYLAGVTAMLSAFAMALALLSLTGVELRYAMRDEPWYLLAWILVACIPAFLILCSMCALVPFLRFAQTRSVSSAELTSATAARKYLCIWSTQDEPTIGLAASGSFAVQFVGDARTARQAPWKLRWALISTAINQFVNNLLSRKVQGSSLSHLELRTVQNFPHEALAHRALAWAADSDIISRADDAAAALGKRVRELLLAGSDPVTGFEDLKSAAARAFTFKELVHTSYFESNTCTDLIRHHIQGASTCKPRVSPPSDAVIEWYASRLDDVGALTQTAAALAIPSNQVGHAVTLGSLAVAVLLALSALSQRSLLKVALEPTTQAYHLSTVVHASNIANALKWTTPDEASPIILAYLGSVARADQVPFLMQVVTDKAALHLTRIFQSNGMVPLLRVATGPQILWLLEHHGQLLVERHTAPGRGGQIYSIAGLVEAAQGLVSEAALNERSYALLKAPCGEDANCVGVVANLTARAIARRGQAVPAFMLPLPADFPSVKVHTSCRENLGSGSCNATAPASRAGRAKAAPRFWGDGGALEILSPVASAAQISSAELEVALDSFRKQLCLPSGDRGQVNANDEVRLARIFHRAPREALVKPAVNEWVSILNGRKKLCEQGPDLSGADTSVPVAWFTFSMADWIARFDPAFAKEVIMPLHAQQGTAVLLEKRTYWLLAHGHVADVIRLIEDGGLGLDPLVARAGYFQLAACMQLTAKVADASSLAQAAETIGPLYRNMSPEIVTLARSEAMYNIARRDWRRAFTACDSCDAAQKVEFSSDMLQFAVSDAPHKLLTHKLSCPSNLDAVRPSQAAISAQVNRF